MNLLEHEALIRLVCFGALLSLLAACEYLRPGCSLRHSRLRRWANNFGLLAIYSVAIRLFMPLALTAIAAWWQGFELGLLRQVSPWWLHGILALVILDCIIYWQHRLMHMLPWLWRLHAIHHSDADLDVSSAVRFHPLEITVSLLVKLAAIMLLGVHPLAVLVFELILSSSALFNHANLRFPQGVDQFVRLFWVTPNMHRIHHSCVWREHNQNFGFALSCWDRLFHSYCKQASGERKLASGLGDAAPVDFPVGLPSWANADDQFEQRERLRYLLLLDVDRDTQAAKN